MCKSGWGIVTPGSANNIRPKYEYKCNIPKYKEETQFKHYLCSLNIINL